MESPDLSNGLEQHLVDMSADTYTPNELTSMLKIITRTLDGCGQDQSDHTDMCEVLSKEDSAGDMNITACVATAALLTTECANCDGPIVATAVFHIANLLCPRKTVVVFGYSERIVAPLLKPILSTICNTPYLRRFVQARGRVLEQRGLWQLLNS